MNPKQFNNTQDNRRTRDVISPKIQLKNNLATDGDSYKWSHWNQYPEGTTRMMSYFEARGGEFKECTLFGLQYLIHQYLAEPLTREDVEEASAFASAHGEPFNREGWLHIVERYGGRLPVIIRAIAEGTVVPVGNVLLTIECDDPVCFWVVSWLETMLVRLWYPSTVAIMSRESKKTLRQFLELSADDPDAEISFKLHDFGARGVATLEQARLGGAAHLLSFLGSDTIEGIRMANHFYDSEMAGFSIPASEHSTVSMWGADEEEKMFAQYIDTYLTNAPKTPGVPLMAACVSDTWNIFKATSMWSTGKLAEALRKSGGTLVIRPDSGDPLKVLPRMFEILEENLGEEITQNTKGYKLLPAWLRVIQGDGIDRESMKEILATLTALGWSASNLAFGSGGGLLQKVNRDTQKWAFKCCYAEINGKPVEVRKNPITDRGKQSKAGRLDLVQREQRFETICLSPGQGAADDSVLITVFDHGDILFHNTLDECRQRMEA